MQTPNINDLVTRYAQVAPKYRFAGWAGGVGALCLVYLLTVQLDQNAQLQDLQDHLQTTESQRSEKYAYAANLPLYEARLTELSARLTDARAMLPDAPNVPQFLSQIGAIARDVGLTIQRFEPQSEVPLDFYAETLFALQVRGTFHEIGMFLDRASRMDRIVNVSGLAMGTPIVDSQRVVVTGTFSLKAFRSLSAEEMAALQSADKAKKDKR
jgi:type IV pilus assembly protein PilO